MAKPKAPTLDLVIWANIFKWMMLRNVDESELASVLRLKTLSDRKRSRYLTVEEMGTVCSLLAIEPEKLLER